MVKVALAALLGTESLTKQRNGLTVYNDTEPLGLLYIASAALEEGHDVRVFHPFQRDNTTEMDIVKNIIEYKPDVLGISSLTNNFPRSVKLAERVKKSHPGITTIFGGEHPQATPESIGTIPSIDLIVMGEGEVTIREILKGKPWNLIEGIAYRDGTKVQINKSRSRIMDRTEIPWAFRDPEMLAESKVGTLMYPPPEKQTGAASFLFQYGCPFRCSYCTAPLFGKKITKSSAEYVVAEMIDVKDRFGINTAFFTDLTFNALRHNSEELCRSIEEANLGIDWYALIRPTSPLNQPMIKDSTLEAMVAAGCTKIGFGIESWEEGAMRDYHRPTSLEEDERALRKIDALGALTKVFLMIGHPDERPEYYDRVIDQLKRLQPDEVRIAFLTPFPGTKLWNKIDHNIITTRDYGQYTTFKPVLKMTHITQTELVGQRRKILHEYYSSPEYHKHVQEKIAQHPKFAQSYDAFAIALQQHQII